MTSFRAGIVLRSTNLLVLLLWLYRIHSRGPVAVSLTVPAAVFAVYIAANLALAWKNRHPPAGYETCFFAADILLAAWAAVWSSSFFAGAHLSFLVPAVLAGMRLPAKYAAAVIALGAGSFAGLMFAAPGSPGAGLAYHSAILLLVPATAAVFAARSERPPSGGYTAQLTQQRTTLFNEFINHMLFQIRDYLTSISSVTDHLALSGKDPAVQDLGKKLKHSVSELNGKIGRMLDHLKAHTTSRKKPIRLELDLSAVIKKSLDLAEIASPVPGVSVRLWVDPKIGVIHGDQETLTVVLTNVLTNSLEALAKRRETRKLRISAELHGAAAQIDIVDNGGGLPDDARKNLFSPLFTTKSAYGNMGIGLAMSRRMLERTGGTMLVKSENDRTIVRIDVPLEPSLPVIRTEESTWAGRRSRDLLEG